MPHLIRKGIYAFTSIALMLAAIGCEQKLYFDAHGFPHGSGEQVHAYKSGSPMLMEEYVDGQLKRSRWFDPQGNLIQETNWVDGSGEGLYLREDGSIRVRMKYVAGLAEGPAVYYDAQGNIEKTVEFSNGQPIGEE